MDRSQQHFERADRLDIAEWRVRQAEACGRRLREIVDELSLQGINTAQLEDILSGVQSSLALMRASLDRLALCSAAGPQDWMQPAGLRTRLLH